MSGAERPLDEQLRSSCPLEHVDVLVAELTDNAQDPASLDSDAGSYRVDPLVLGLYRHLCPVTGNADNLLHSDEAVADLRDFLLEKSLQELRSNP